jgi:hypothetical protein
MFGILMESVVIAFVMGGILGAVTALHLSGNKKVALKIENKRRGREQQPRQQ